MMIYAEFWQNKQRDKTYQIRNYQLNFNCFNPQISEYSLYF